MRRDERRREGENTRGRVGTSAGSTLHEYSISRDGVISQAAYSLSKLSRRPTPPSITIRERNFASLSISPLAIPLRRKNQYIYYLLFSSVIYLPYVYIIIIPRVSRWFYILASRRLLHDNLKTRNSRTYLALSRNSYCKSAMM